MDLTSLSLSQLLAKFESKDASARDAVTAYNARIHRLNKKLGAYLATDPDAALAEAHRIDDARARGEGVGRLAGAPLGIKDIICTRGMRTTCSSRILENFVPPYDATVVERLRGAGAIVLGKTNCDEFAMGSSNENSAFAHARNPFDPDRVPGGSSGGSAVAVSADMAVATIGTDTGGSIRQPAALSGCVGVKPTYGRVSRYGLVAFASSLDQAGPMTKTVEDAALLSEIICGHDARDSTSASREVPSFVAATRADVRGLRVAVPTEYFGAGLSGPVRESVKGAIDAYAKAGAQINEVSLPHTQYAVATYYIVATAEASSNLGRYDGVRYGARQEGQGLLDMYSRTRSLGFGPEVQRRILLGTYVLSAGYYEAYYHKAMQVRTLIRRDFETVFRSNDVILGPVSPTTAWRIGEKVSDPLAMYLSDIYTIAVNLAGLPGMSLPCGVDSDGLPIGLQVIAAPFREEDMFRAAGWFEREVKPVRLLPVKGVA